MQDELLFLGPDNSPLISWLKDHQGEHVTIKSHRLNEKDLDGQRYFFLVSYGYRYILSKEILKMFPNRAINLHISYLPWNRGSDPNFWSFIENSPKGVTIHYLDEGIDTGDIIVQKKVHFDSDQETLFTTYNKLQTEIQELFKINWNRIRTGNCQRQKQIGIGSVHKQKDKQKLKHLLRDGWNTPVSVLKQLNPSDTMKD